MRAGDDTSSGLRRRSFLLAAGGVVGSVSGAASVVALNRGDDASSVEVRPSKYVLEQGNDCVPLAMVTTDDDLPVEEFYDYRSSDTTPSGWYSSYGPAQVLQRNGESVCYLYDGSRGTSLVFMHGQRGGERGGAVTFTVTGLPSDGEWAVTDDQYDAPTNYDRFRRTDDGWVVDWTWATDPDNGGGADGGAFRGLTSDDVVRIDPAFNEDARLYGDHYPGEVVLWSALTADSTGYGWHTLHRDRSVVVRGGSCEQTDSPKTTTATQTTGTTTTTETTTASQTTATTTMTETTASQTATTTPSSSRSRTQTPTTVGGGESRRTTSFGQGGFGVATAVTGVLGGALSTIFRRDS